MPRTETLQSTNRYVCSRHSTMHPVRPGGTRTTDSSSPMAQPLHPLVERPSRATSASAHCGWANTARMAVRALPDARFPIEELPFAAADPFDSREPSSPIHETRSAARAPGTL